MQRREFLAVAAAGSVAGCSSLRRVGSVPDRRVIAASVEREPTGFGVTVRVSVVEPSITAGHTARIALALHNGGDSPVVIGFDRQEPDPLYSIDESFDRDPGVVLLPPGGEPDHRRPGCWKPPDGYRFGGAGLGEATELQSGETFRREFTLWTDPTVDGCLPTGRYLFGRQFTGTDGTDGDGTDSDGTDGTDSDGTDSDDRSEFSWRVALRLGES